MKQLGIDQIQDIMEGKPAREPANWRSTKETANAERSTKCTPSEAKQESLS